MGLRSRIKKFADRFSGEFSQAAEGREEIPYDRDAGPSDSSTVVKARLKRPRDAASEEEDNDSST